MENEIEDIEDIVIEDLPPRVGEFIQHLVIARRNVGADLLDLVAAAVGVTQGMQDIEDNLARFQDDTLSPELQDILERFLATTDVAGDHLAQCVRVLEALAGVEVPEVTDPLAQVDVLE
jgi:hypothetical protein